MIESPPEPADVGRMARPRQSRGLGEEGAASRSGRNQAGVLALRPVPPADGIPTKRCANGHPNDPEAADCRICHRPIDVAASVVDLSPQVLGRLLVEDGTAAELEAELVIGRCPPTDADAETLAVAGRQVSRRHLTIEVRGWRLLIRDLGSTNGTFVTRRGERGRRRIPEDHSVALRIGDSVHFGGRQALVVAPPSRTA